MYTSLLLAALASAQGSPFEDKVENEHLLDEPGFFLSAELGGAWATGNVDYHIVNGALEAARRFEHDQLTLEAGANLGKGVADADGDGALSAAERSVGKVETTRKYWAEPRYDRFVGERASIYALVGALSDIYAGYRLNTHEQVGYARVLLDNGSTKLEGELGVDVAQERYVAGVDPDFAMVYSGRVMAQISQALGESVSFTEKVEVLENVIDPTDLRVQNKATLSVALNDVLAVKLSNKLGFDNVPVQGYRKLDQVTLVSLVATLP